MKKDIPAEKLIQGDEFEVISRRGKKSALLPNTYVVQGKETSKQLNNNQTLGVAKDGTKISIGEKTRVIKYSSQGPLED